MSVVSSAIGAQFNYVSIYIFAEEAQFMQNPRFLSGFLVTSPPPTPSLQVNNVRILNKLSFGGKNVNCCSEGWRRRRRRKARPKTKVNVGFKNGVDANKGRHNVNVNYKSTNYEYNGRNRNVNANYNYAKK